FQRDMQRQEVSGGFKLAHLIAADGTVVFFKMTSVFPPFIFGQGARREEACLLPPFIPPGGVLFRHTHKYSFFRFFLCITPFPRRSFIVPRGCPSAVAISVWLIP